MDWTSERYVRLYTRETAEWRAFCWQAKALLPLMLMRADRAGVVAIRSGNQRPRLLAGLVGLPPEVTETGIADLLLDGCVVDREAGYVVRNFIDAQEAEASDAKRAREHRARRREQALATVTATVTFRDGSSREPPFSEQTVTFRDETVTPSLAVPSRAVPNHHHHQEAAAVDSSIAISEVATAHQAPEPEAFEADSSGEYQPTAWGFWGWHNHERQQRELFDEPTPPHTLRVWHDKGKAKVGIEGLIRSYLAFLDDVAFAARGWPFAIFTSEAVWLPRANASARARVRL